MSFKKCKGTGKALGSGCGEPKSIHKYGLCLDCFKHWLFNTDEGKEYLDKTQLRAKKRVVKEEKQKARIKKEEQRKKSYYEKQLQNEINAIVRLIDTDKGCISCDHGWSKPVTRQMHAGHYYSVGSNPTLRYHLFDIFKQCSICNNHKSGNERAYEAGILRIYGQGMLNYIKSLPSKYRSLNLSKEELKEKIKIARQIKRDILNGNDYNRSEINVKLGIYNAKDIRERRLSVDHI